MAIDLSHAPVVDTPLPSRGATTSSSRPTRSASRTGSRWSGCASSRPGSPTRRPRPLGLLTATTPLALTMRRRLAEYLGCEATQAAVAEARRGGVRRRSGRVLRAAVGGREHRRARSTTRGTPSRRSRARSSPPTSGAAVHRVGRIEPWIAALQRQVASFAELEDAFVAAARGARPRDPELVAFKSVIAYRTGLDVERAARPTTASAAFQALARRRAQPRRASTQSRFATRCCAARSRWRSRHDRPVHIHCGGGDPAIVLGHARPQDLFPLLSEHADQPVVLIHSGWPWLEEGAYVASVLPQVYLDMSITMPWASLAIDRKLEVLLGAAPPAKVLYGSDEASEPEVIWLSAQLGREALGRVLDDGGRAPLARRGRGARDRRGRARRERAPVARLAGRVGLQLRVESRSRPVATRASEWANGQERTWSGCSMQARLRLAFQV